MTDDRTFTVGEVAARLRVSTATVTNWLRDGRLRGYRIGGTRAGWRVEANDLDRFIAERKGETSTAEIRADMTERRAAMKEQRRDTNGEEQK
ncbi:MAG: helix-turn-helix domain-containing protein [Dehalococcoidia bacterium]